VKSRGALGHARGYYAFMAEPNGYLKARNYDASKQRHNQAVFVGWLRARPIAGMVLSGLFVALGIGLLLVPNPRAHPVWIVTVLAFGTAGYLLAITFGAGRKE
jgi:uncharacterized RDD family membrane protein YckC